MESIHPHHYQDFSKRQLVQSSFLVAPSTILFLPVLFCLNFLKIYFWLYRVFVAARALPLIAASGDYPFLWCMGLSRSGFSCCGAWTLGMWAQQLWHMGCLTRGL